METPFERKLQDAILHERVTLGSMPSVVAKISAAAGRQDITARELANELLADPVLAGRLLRVANSSRYRGSQPVTKLQLAIARLGLPVACKLVLTLALSHAVKPSHPELRSRLAQQWKHSIEVAAMSRVLADHYADVDPEEAFLAGLVHRIGVLPIINMADQMPGTAIRLDILDKSIRTWQAKVGSLLLRTWHFPPTLVGVCLDVENPHRDHPGPADVSDLVFVALHQVGATTVESLDVTQTPAWQKLGLDAAQGLVLGVDVDEQIEEARSLLE
ncbi:MAG TPA: HDOD domain-containing protein [Nevskiaceae bacterium]|nr:HDOD domain-containing protein [Nevskiaceae bacterium]